VKFLLQVLVIPALCVFVLSCSSTRQSKFHPNQKYSAQVLRQDLSLLKNILESNHPSLYWYTTKDSLDYFFNTTINSITDSLTELEFKNKVAGFISKIHCGHTAVRSSKQYGKYFTGKRVAQFPLSLKIWNDSAVLISTAFRNDSLLKRGTIITSINGRSNTQLLDSMSKFISADGYSKNFSQQLISFNYPFYYKNTFGLDSQYRVRFIDSSGKSSTAIFKNFL
jgi:hypothetical protein